MAMVLIENPDGTGRVREVYTPDEHLTQVINKTWNFSGRLVTDRDHITNAVLGLGGEAGEVVDLVKKEFFHTPKDGRREELLGECGDVAYYLLKTLDVHGYTLEDALQANREKLMARHPKFFEEVK